MKLKPNDTLIALSPDNSETRTWRVRDIDHNAAEGIRALMVLGWSVLHLPAIDWLALFVVLMPPMPRFEESFSIRFTSYGYSISDAYRPLVMHELAPEPDPVAHAMDVFRAITIVCVRAMTTLIELDNGPRKAAEDLPFEPLPLELE